MLYVIKHVVVVSHLDIFKVTISHVYIYDFLGHLNSKLLLLRCTVHVLFTYSEALELLRW